MAPQSTRRGLLLLLRPPLPGSPLPITRRYLLLSFAVFCVFSGSFVGHLFPCFYLFDVVSVWGLVSSEIIEGRRSPSPSTAAAEVVVVVVVAAAGTRRSPAAT